MSTKEIKNVSHMDTIGRIDFDRVAVKAAYDKMVRELIEATLAERGWKVAKGSKAIGFVMKGKGMPAIGGFYLNPDKTKAPAIEAPNVVPAELPAGLTPEMLAQFTAILLAVETKASKAKAKRKA